MLRCILLRRNSKRIKCFIHYMRACWQKVYLYVTWDYTGCSNYDAVDIFLKVSKPTVVLSLGSIIK
jgi:hypothetical protein